jgi:hypothetical protein
MGDNQAVALSLVVSLRPDSVPAYRAEISRCAFLAKACGPILRRKFGSTIKLLTPLHLLGRPSKLMMTDILFTDVADFPVTCLRLSARPLRALHGLGVQTVGELWVLYSQDPSLAGISGLGRRGSAEIEQKLVEFRERLAHTPPDQWAELRDPRQHFITVQAEQPNLLSILPSFVEAVSNVYASPRESEIIKRRYGLDGGGVYTLEDIGYFFTLTRERVRQLEDRARKRLVLALSGLDKHPEFKTPAQVSQEFEELGDLLKSQGPLVAQGMIVSILSDRYGGGLTQQMQVAIPLLVELLGGVHVRAGTVGIRDESGSVWRFGDVDLKQISWIIQTVRAQLEESVHSQSLFSLTVALNRLRQKRVTPEDIRSALRLMDDVEEIGNDEFRIRFTWLKSTGDRAYAILLDEGKPLHFREIARKINQRLVNAGQQPSLVLHQNLGSLLSGDDRLEPLAKSGLWKLREWSHIRSERVLDLIQEAISAKHEAASYDEIYEYVRKLRPEVPRQSVLSFVALRPDLFHRVSGGKIELAAWGKRNESESVTRRSRGARRREMKEAILRLIEEERTTTIQLAKVVQRVRSDTGLPDNTVRARLARATWAEIRGSSGDRVIEIDPVALTQDVAVDRPRARIRTEIENRVRAFLTTRRDGPASFREIWEYIRRTSRIKQPTLYAVLSAMRTLTKTRREQRVYYALEDHRVDEPLRLPGLETVVDDRLKANLETAESNLNLKNIDSGLFQLGKIFEGQLREFLLLVQVKGAFPVSRKDMSTLGNMIDCIVNNGIVRSAHHLTLLREQRNERAHEAMPDQQQRQELMTHAPFLVHLYMRYIVIINERLRQLADS